MTLDVAPGKSILDAMIEADVFVSYECKRGECGNCYAGVMSELSSTTTNRKVSR